MSQNTCNQKYANNADGWELAGGTTARKLTLTGADVTITGSGANAHTFPPSASTLAATNLAQTFSGVQTFSANIDAEALISYENAFTFTLEAAASSASVSFPTAFAGGVTPVVICTPPYQTSFWITSITNTGFTFNVGTTDAYAQSINCIAMATT